MADHFNALYATMFLVSFLFKLNISYHWWKNSYIKLFFLMDAVMDIGKP